jgi:thioesterase domain-containing protein
MPWTEAGGDSFGALQLWHLLENELGTKLPLDPFTSRTTPSGLVSAIGLILESTAANAVHEDTAQQLPLVFFVPHAFGDAPYLAEIRAQIKDRIRFRVIQYPELAELAADRGVFDQLVDGAEAQVLARCGEEACLLVGLSFGGFVAWETARRLQQTGHSVGLVGLIDSQFVESSRSPRGFSLSFSWGYWQPRHLSAICLRFLAKSLVRAFPLWILLYVDRLGAFLPAMAAFRFRHQLVSQLRAMSLRKDILEPLQVPATLFRSEEYAADLPDHGWKKLCNQLVIVPVRGGHFPDSEDLGIKLVQAIEIARKYARRPAAPIPIRSLAAEAKL